MFRPFRPEGHSKIRFPGPPVRQPRLSHYGLSARCGMRPVLARSSSVLWRLSSVPCPPSSALRPPPLTSRRGQWVHQIRVDLAPEELFEESVGFRLLRPSRKTRFADVVPILEFLKRVGVELEADAVFGLFVGESLPGPLVAG